MNVTAQALQYDAKLADLEFKVSLLMWALSFSMACTFEQASNPLHLIFLLCCVRVKWDNVYACTWWSVKRYRNISHISCLYRVEPLPALPLSLVSVFINIHEKGIQMNGKGKQLILLLGWCFPRSGKRIC